MSHGKIQLVPQHTLGSRVVTIAQPRPADGPGEEDAPLFINVLRRRWMLLVFCGLLSATAALLVIGRFSLPKAISSGQLRYVDLPPTLKGVYQPPKMLEFTEILKSNEIMAELARRTGLATSPKDLHSAFALEASRYSNIIDIQYRGRDGKQAIDLINELMRIACETIVANRKETLSQYATEAKLQYEVANERVVGLRERLVQLRRQRDARLVTDGTLPDDVEALKKKIERADEMLEDLSMRRLAANQQLESIRRDVETLQAQIRSELLGGRRGQIQARKRLYNPNSERFRKLEAAEAALANFERNDATLDYETWNAKLQTIGLDVVGPLEQGVLVSLSGLERQLSMKEARIEQIELELLPMDTTESMWETRREQWERELTVAEDGTDADTMAMEEAQAELDQAMMARARLLDHLNNIQRGQETDFDEMTVLTPASWQTTVTSDGKLKLFIVTLGGCLFVLVLPVFALEHFFPSGDPATHASRTLRIPCISRGTFVAGRLTRDPSSLQGVNSEAMRLLALRIQQSVHGSGSVVLFSGLNHEKSSIPMISYLAECLSRREERVLIIDACDRGDEANGRSDKADKIYSPLWPQQADRDAAAPQGAGQPTNGHDQQTHSARLPVNLQDHAEPGVLGLADLLHRRELPSEEMICATSISGVDIIPCGTTRFPREGMASSRLSALFDECRQRYTIILVAGPSTTHPSDLQMLSARADAILFTVPPSGCRAGHGEEVVRDLLDMGAPVIGIVS